MDGELLMESDQIPAVLDHVIAELGKVIIGQQALVHDVLLSLMCGGHVLMEGPPGLAKTLLAKSLGQVLALQFTRLQCTPDLTPTDILGAGESRGPIFTQVLLADEINRAQPKSQSALLEAMQEQHVTKGVVRQPLGPPFFMMATQNPIDMEGTYPLPEAQLDRFLMKIMVTYPGRADLREILFRTTQPPPPPLQLVLTSTQILEIQSDVRSVPISEAVQDYIARLVLATHPESGYAPTLTKRYGLYGASPRGAQSLALGGKALALWQQSGAVTYADIRAVAIQSLQHRVILNFEGTGAGIDTASIIQEILDQTPEEVDD
jgi:MoxR-like ATPase